MKKIKMKTLKKTIFFVLFFVLVSFAHAEFIGQSFKGVAEFSAQNIKFPKLLEFNIEDPTVRSVLIYDETSDKFIPSQLIEKNKIKTKVSIVSGGGNNPQALIDNKNTVSEFAVDGDNMARSEIVFEFNPPADIEGFELVLDRNVSLPVYATVYDVSNAKVLLAKSRVQSEFIHFPRTHTRQIALRLEHIQPLRLIEVRPIYSKKLLDQEKKLRFLAKPNHKYKIFANQAYGEVLGEFEEAPNFYDTEGLVKAGALKFAPNPAFKEPDSDGDGIIDKLDNCVFVSNKNQKDADKNGRGDACDDFDKDGVINSRDNCPNTPNYNQSDKDRDGLGDACDKEESRFFEKNKWLIWVAIGFLFALFAIMAYFIYNNTNKKDSGAKNAEIGADTE